MSISFSSISLTVALTFSHALLSYFCVIFMGTLATLLFAYSNICLFSVKTFYLYSFFLFLSLRQVGKFILYPLIALLMDSFILS